MKRKPATHGWTVYYSHFRPEDPARWSRQTGLRDEASAIAVAQVLTMQRMIVNAIYEGEEQRYSEAELSAIGPMLVPEFSPTAAPAYA